MALLLPLVVTPFIPRILGKTDGNALLSMLASYTGGPQLCQNLVAEVFRDQELRILESWSAFRTVINASSESAGYVTLDITDAYRMPALGIYQSDVFGQRVYMKQ